MKPFSIPNLPTDNLYKFYSLAGITITLFSFTFLVFFFQSLSDKIYSTERSINELTLDKEYLIEDNKLLQIKLSQLENSIQEYGITESNPDSTLTKFSKLENQISKIQDDPNWRDYLEFLYKYESYLIPEIKKKNEIELLAKEHFSNEREYRLKSIQLESKICELSRKKSQLFFVVLIGIIGVSFGIRLARKGFIDWKEKVQNLVDKKLQIEINILELEEESLKPKTKN